MRVYPIGCVTKGRKGEQLAPLAELAGAGAIAFSDDGDPVEDESLMREALRQARACSRVLFPHEEFRAISAGGCMHAGDVSKRLGVGGMDPAAEDDMIERDIELVRETGGALHIAHISTAGWKSGLSTSCSASSRRPLPSPADASAPAKTSRKRRVVP